MVMLTNAKRTLGALVTAPMMGVLMTGGVAAASETCDRRTARDLMRAGDYAGLCDCTQVTPSFLQRLQRGSNFEAVLGVTGEQCPGLAALLTDFATSSVASAAVFRGEDRSSDGNEIGDAGGGAPGGETAEGQGGAPEGEQGGAPGGGPEGDGPGGEPGGESGGEPEGKPGENAGEAAEGADRAAEARARAEAARENANAKAAEARARAEAARSGSGSKSKGGKSKGKKK